MEVLLELLRRDQESQMVQQKNKVLVVEDEGDIRDLISLHLKRQRYEVTEACSAEEAREKLSNEAFQLIILDWMLPEQSGLDFLKSIRSEAVGSKVTPVMMVTARSESSDIIEGLNAGADDYVSKPFDLDVLLARVKALVRRGHEIESDQASGNGDSRVYQVGSVEINEDLYQAKCSGIAMDLTKSEFKLLLALLQNRGRVLTRSQIIEQVQGKGIKVIDRAVDTHIFGLRKKMGPCADIIETVRGIGYRVAP